MACRFVRVGDGVAILCGPRARTRYCSCGKPAVALCDFPLAGRMAGKDCDRPVCAGCRVQQDGKDYCRPHAVVLAARPAGASPGRTQGGQLDLPMRPGPAQGGGQGG
jgi:hypothetical protein